MKPTWKTLFSRLACIAVGVLYIGALPMLTALGSKAIIAAEPRTAAIFDFELIDTSLEGEVRGAQPAEQERLVLISDHLRRLLAESGKFEIIDVAPAAQAITDAGFLHACNGCEADIAQQLEADLAIRGVVQKVSNLILNLNIYVTDARTGDHLDGMSVDIRGNTDESWLRGVTYIVRNRFSGTR